MTTDNSQIDIKKAELIITALQERIGDIVSSYETQIALYRADMTVLADELNSLKSSIEEAKGKNV
jgi:hypothetical protein